MTLDNKTRANLRSKATKVDTTIKVGKSGITDTVVEELRNQVKRRGLVKVGLLKSATYEAGKDEIATELATRAGVELVEVRGNTAVYWNRTAKLD